MKSRKDIKAIASEFREGLLGKDSSFNECYKVSTALQGYLSFIGIESKLVKYEVDASNSNYPLEMEYSKIDTIVHYCLRIEDKILDATADQFKGMPKVFFGGRPMYYMECVELENPN